MNKENLILRLLGLILLLIGAFWFWRTSFTLTTVWGVPLPLSLFVIVIGLFILVIPAPFLNIVGAFLPKERREQVEDFSKKYLNDENSKRVVFTPEDEGQTLSDKLNKALLISRRRFYIVFLFVLVFSPLLAFYFIKLNEYKKENLIRQSDELVSALRTNRLTFSSADSFRGKLKETDDLKNTSDKSSTGRIYGILEHLYANDVKDEETFQSKLSAVYEKDIKGVLDSHNYNFKAIKAPISDTDSKDAKEALHILLAIICNLKGKNGLFMEPYLYGRGILNEITSRPGIFYHVSGWNYGGLFKSTLRHKFETYDKLAKAAFPSGLPTTKWSLAAKGLSEYKEYIKFDTSQLALVRQWNNVVDIHLPIIYFLRVKHEVFQPQTDEENVVYKIKNENLDELFKRLHADLNKTKTFMSDAIIDTTAAQLYSLEGEANAEENTPHSKDPEWNEELRKKALDRIRHAYKPHLNESRETFSFDNRETSYLTWLWNHPETKKKLQEIFR